MILTAQVRDAPNLSPRPINGPSSSEVIRAQVQRVPVQAMFSAAATQPRIAWCQTQCVRCRVGKPSSFEIHGPCGPGSTLWNQLADTWRSASDSSLKATHGPVRGILAQVKTQKCRS